MRVVQIEPGPIPTFMASAPASIKALAAASVATLPAMMSTSDPTDFLMDATVSITPDECPWAVSTTMASAHHRLGQAKKVFYEDSKYYMCKRVRVEDRLQTYSKTT